MELDPPIKSDHSQADTRTWLLLLEENNGNDDGGDDDSDKTTKHHSKNLATLEQRRGELR